MRKTLKQLLTEYGAVAAVVYFAIFFLVLFGVWFALQAGWTPASATGKVGRLATAYITTKVTQPIRIAATVVLTPLVARLYERITGRTAAPPPPPQPPELPPSPSA